MEFEIGDVVMLRSGSPGLTISRLTLDHSDGPVVEVEWFDGAECRRDGFLGACLVKFDTKPPVE